MNKKGKIVLALGLASAISVAAAVGIAQAHKSGGGHGYGGHGGYHMGHGGHHKGWRRGKHRRHMMKHFMKRYDADNDGKITQAEIDTNRTDWHKKYDTDGNGSLSLKEFEDLWLEARRRAMVRAFQRLDEDGNAAVTLGEYTEPMSGIVERMDRNGDGALSREDRRRHKKWRHRQMKEDGGKASNQ